MNVDVSSQLFARFSKIRFNVKHAVVFKLLYANGQTGGRTQRS